MRKLDPIRKLRLVLLIVAFLISPRLFSQGCDNTKFISLPNIDFKGNPFNENFITKYFNNSIYIVKSGNNSIRTLLLQQLDTFWKYDIAKEKKSFLLIENGKLPKKYRKAKATDFFIDGDLMYLLTDKALLTYAISGKKAIYKNAFKTSNSHQYIIGKIDVFLILYVGYNYHPLDQKEKVIISKFSTKSNKIVKSIYPKMLGVELTHSNKRFCTIHNNTILFAQPFSDTICIYNSELERIGKIELKHKVDATIKINYEEYSTDQIQKLLLEDYLYQRNIKIDVFGDTLLVLHKKKFQNFRGSIWFDVYTHKNNTWKLTDTSKFISFTLDSNKKVLPTTTYVPYIIDNNPIMVHNGSMYELINKYVEVKKPITYKEYNYFIDLAFYNNTFKVTLQEQPLECLFKP